MRTGRATRCFDDEHRNQEWVSLKSRDVAGDPLPEFQTDIEDMKKILITHSMCRNCWNQAHPCVSSVGHETAPRFRLQDLKLMGEHATP